MLLPLKQVIKLYSMSNVCFYKMCDIIYDENINKIFFSKESIMLQFFNIISISLILLSYQDMIKKNKKIIKLNSFYNNNNIEKMIDFIFITIAFIFIKNIENAI